MKIKLMILPLLSTLLWQSAALATDDEKLSAIAEMGHLNGIALQCKYLEQVRKIKQVLVLNLPTERALGDWFEQKTSASFMDFMKDDSSCPGLIGFDKELDVAVKNLETAYKK